MSCILFISYMQKSIWHWRGRNCDEFPFCSFFLFVLKKGCNKRFYFFKNFCENIWKYGKLYEEIFNIFSNIYTEGKHVSFPHKSVSNWQHIWFILTPLLFPSSMLTPFGIIVDPYVADAFLSVRIFLFFKINWNFCYITQYFNVFFFHLHETIDL